MRKAERGGHGGKGQDFSFRYVVFEIRYPGGVTEKEGGKTCLASGKDTRKSPHKDRDFGLLYLLLFS